MRDQRRENYQGQDEEENLPERCEEEQEERTKGDLCLMNEAELDISNISPDDLQKVISLNLLLN